MKKCRQCGMLSADTATVCRSCRAKFTEEDTPIVVPTPKKKKNTLSIIVCVVLFILIAGVILLQSGILTTWIESSKKEEIKIISEEFINADFENDTQKVTKYMFESYITIQKKDGVLFLPDGKYNSVFFAQYSQDVSIKVINTNIEFMKEEFDFYNNEIQNKYNVAPDEIVSLTVEVQITDGDMVSVTTVPLTVISLDKNWFVMPVI